MSKRLIALLLGALAIGLIAGCGSSDSNVGGEISTNSLTKAEYIEQASAICTKHHDQIENEFEALVQKSGGLPKGKKAKDFFAAAAATIIFPSATREIEEFHALGAPRRSEDEVETMLVAFETGVKEAEKTGDITKRPAEIEKSNELATKFGLKNCMEN